MKKFLVVTAFLLTLTSAVFASDTCCVCMTHAGFFASCQFEPSSLACVLTCSDQGYENSYIGSHLFAPDQNEFNVCPDCDGQWPSTPTPADTPTPIFTPTPIDTSIPTDTPSPIPTPTPLPAIITVKICTYTTNGVKLGCFVTDLQPALIPRILLFGAPNGKVCEKTPNGGIVNCYELDTGQ